MNRVYDGVLSGSFDEIAASDQPMSTNRSSTAEQPSSVRRDVVLPSHAEGVREGYSLGPTSAYPRSRTGRMT